MQGSEADPVHQPLPAKDASIEYLHRGVFLGAATPSSGHQRARGYQQALGTIRQDCAQLPGLNFAEHSFAYEQGAFHGVEGLSSTAGRLGYGGLAGKHQYYILRDAHDCVPSRLLHTSLRAIHLGLKVGAFLDPCANEP